MPMDNQEALRYFIDFVYTQFRKANKFMIFYFSLTQCQDEEVLDESIGDLVIDESREEQEEDYGYILIGVLFILLNLVN